MPETQVADQEVQLPPSLTNEDNARPPDDQVVDEAKRKFVLPAEDEETPVQEPEKQATPSEPETEKPESAPADEKKAEEAETPEQAEKRKTRRFERRLDRLYKRAAEEKAAREIAERRLAEIEASRQPKDDSGKPRIEDFDYDIEKWGTAVEQWTEKRLTQEHEQRQQQQAAQTVHQTLSSKWEEQIAKGEDKYEDFADAIGEIKPDNPISVAIMESEVGADLAYYLYNNPEEVDRLAKLSPVSQVREVGKIEALIVAAASGKDEPPAPSKAPEPINPVSSGAANVSEGPTEEMDMATWIKERRKQVYGRRGRH